MPARRDQTGPLGVVYTPPALARAMVVGLLEPLVRGRTASEILALRVCDPAMGDGAFLVEVVQYLAERVVAASQREHPAAAPGSKGARIEWAEAQERIAHLSVVGVDIDPASVATVVERMSAFRGKGFRSIGFPFLREGNALTLDWLNSFGPFDAVIANPPYIRQESLAGEAVKKADLRNWRTYDGVADLYVYFIELAHGILKPGGRYAVVAPNKWMTAEYARPLRAFLAEQKSVDALVDLSAIKVFENADAFPCILFGTTGSTEGREMKATKLASSNSFDAVVAANEHVLRVEHRGDDVDAPEIVSIDRKRLDDAPWHIDSIEDAALLARLKRDCRPLGEIIGTRWSRGVVTGYNDAFVIDEKTRDLLLAADPRGPTARRQRGETQPGWAAAAGLRGGNGADDRDTDEMDAVRDPSERDERRDGPAGWDERRDGPAGWDERRDGPAGWDERRDELAARDDRRDELAARDRPDGPAGWDERRDGLAARDDRRDGPAGWDGWRDGPAGWSVRREQIAGRDGRRDKVAARDGRRDKVAARAPQRGVLLPDIMPRDTDVIPRARDPRAVVATSKRAETQDETLRTEDLIRPFVKGRDIRGYAIPHPRRWILLVDRGTPWELLPAAVRAHLERFRDRLEPRPANIDAKAWSGRKPGAYAWHELQDPVVPLAKSRAQRMLYQDIQTTPLCALDVEGELVPDTTVWILPSQDLVLLAILNSPVYRWIAQRRFPPALNGAVRPKLQYMQQLPIPRVDGALRDEITSCVEQRIRHVAEGENSVGIDNELVKLVFEAYKLSRKERELIVPSGPMTPGVN
ncbi:MAG TPA: N-6 DNA methylase [Kofleriaceae bacterium]